MPVTFINKPNDNHVVAVSDTTSAAVAATLADKSPETKCQIQASRNDLLPEFNVGIVPLTALVSARHPVRKQNARQVTRALRSIQRFGFRAPPIIGKGFEIIDGHVRVEAARRLGLKEIPCIIADDLSDEGVRLLRIALNRIGERGEWDERALKIEFAYMLEFEPDLSVTGFDHPEIDRILVLDDPGSDETDPLDAFGDLPDRCAAAVTRLGDIWHLGPHRVLCGNARSIDDIRLVVGDRILSAVFIDHPFNLSVRKDIMVGRGRFAEFAEASGEMSNADYEDFLRVTIGNMAQALKLGGVFFLCIDWRHVEVLMRVVRMLGLELLNLCIWAKDKPGMGSFYRSQQELVVVAKRPGAPHLNNVQLGIHGRNRTNVWNYAGATGGRKSEEDDFSLHPTVKPVRLVRDAILDVTAIDEVVLDPFLGSGTTLLAAALSRRVCAGIEISPVYVDVAVGRWQKLTGLEAVHEATGCTFAELRADRWKIDGAGRMTPVAAAGSGTSGEGDF